jgi:hypothetical protein
LGSQEIKDSILPCNLHEPHKTWIAQGGKAETTPPGDDKNPYVKRSGHGRSTMGDNVTEKDDEDAGEEKDEEFGDNSAVKYNKELKNSSGYNEDL